MIRNYFFSGILVLLTGLQCVFIPGRPQQTPFEIQRGTNISHWLSQSQRRGLDRVRWFTHSDVDYLAGLGFDHLRIPVDEEQLWDEKGNINREAMDLLHSALAWCAEYKLKVIVDLHILRSHHFNKEEKLLWTDPKAQDRFITCWLDLSAELHKYPVTEVAYEFMNEPVADDPDDWNQLVSRVYQVIRDKEPKRIFFIGSNKWQTVENFPCLKVPDEDPNIFLSFHFYHPFLLTHYQAGWVDIGHYKGPVQYPGQIIADEDLQHLPAGLLASLKHHNGRFNRKILESMLKYPLQKAEETGLRLYCGEWGCLPTVPEADRLQWYKDVRSNFEKHQIAWTTWDYKGGFGIINRAGKEDEVLISVLLPQK